MDDLSGLEWSHSTPSANPPGRALPALRPTPSPSASGRSTPLSVSAGRVLKPSANDSFASLLGTASEKTASKLSLQDRQKQLQEEKARQQTEERRKLDAHFGGSTGATWGSYGQDGSQSSIAAPSLSSKPVAAPNSFTHRNGSSHDSEDDILAAFNASAPVDASSHFPPPQTFDSGRSTPAQTSKPTGLASTDNTYQFNDDDDPFGLNQFKPKATTPSPRAVPLADDDDILGMLGKPVSELPKPKPRDEPTLPPRRAQEEGSKEPTDPRDKAVGELVDMGFPADKAAMALAQTEDGTNVQAAVGILLNEAHEESRQKARGRTDSSQRADARGIESRRRPDGRTDESMPSWMRQEGRDRSGSRHNNDKSEKDLAQAASEMGATFLKGANSLWKASQKKVQKAVADFQQDSDASQPKWMRDAQLQEASSNRKAPQKDITDEAMMLEGGGRPQKPPRPQKTQAQTTFHDELPRRPSPATKEPSLPPKPQERSAARMTRQDLEAQTPQFYVSPARRRGKLSSSPTPPSSEPPSRTTTRSPLAPSSPPLQSKNPFTTPQTQPQQPQSKPTTAKPTKPQRPPRKIPPTSPTAITTSHTHRLAGTQFFKRGDYTAAHTSYTAALAPLPPTHPVSILLHTNRALTALKIGDPKAAIADADSALSAIGAGRGEGEKIDLGAADGDTKEMKDVWGKAVVRKAEALEALEKYGEAVGLWRVAVETGVGGVAGIRGRERCEKALGRGQGGGRKATARRPTTAASKAGGEDSEAVRRMREANEAAERADDERFALTDAVDAKLVAWKGTKSDNLRALLGSLDKVLWLEAGWTKVGMNELVMANRVKIVYMKAIAKVHPDKIPQDATTEQRMISAAVFATLNEAWDKFKKENGL